MTTWEEEEADEDKVQGGVTSSLSRHSDFDRCTIVALSSYLLPSGRLTEWRGYCRTDVGGSNTVARPFLPRPKGRSPRETRAHSMTLPLSIAAAFARDEELRPRLSKDLQLFVMAVIYHCFNSGA